MKGQAVIIGGGFAGLLCAHVAARHFSRVVLLDRGKPVPQLLPERTLALGCAAGILCFLVGNFVAVRLVGI